MGLDALDCDMCGVITNNPFKHDFAEALTRYTRHMGFKTVAPKRHRCLLDMALMRLTGECEGMERGAGCLAY